MAASGFDATIDIVTRHLAAAGWRGPITPALPALRSAIRSIPGAREIDVDVALCAPLSIRWITSYHPGRSAPLSAIEAAPIAAAVEAVIVETLRNHAAS